MLKTNLPDSIKLPNGATLFPVIGGYLKEQPFLTVNNSGVDIYQNGWQTVLGLPDSDVERMIIAVAKHHRLKYRRVQVLSRQSRRARDLYGNLYQPTRWIFVEVRKPTEADFLAAENRVHKWLMTEGIKIAKEAALREWNRKGKSNA